MRAHLPLLALVALFSVACSTSDNPVGPGPGTGTITVGTYASSGTISVGSGGGTITITGGSIDGFKIVVPPGAFTESKSVSISSAAVREHTFGGDFNPISSMIRIDYGGGYATEPMIVHIPVQVPKGHFAMGFYYDEETGELEGIPVSAINDNEIVLTTRHFSGKHLSDGRKGGILSSKTYVDVIVASMESAKLFGLQESGFRPGTDDWEFPNQGSYVASGGHCTGQSITAIWYYGVRKLGANDPPLHDRFSKIPAVWQDNRDGYRFASVVWADQDRDKRWNWADKFEEIGTKRFSHDSLHYLSFAYAIHLTKKPQLIAVRDANGGHAMIVYKTNGRVMSIADPNYPSGYNHFVTLAESGSFMPYESPTRVGDPPKLYPNIYYVSKTAIFSFDGISTRYGEMLKHTIGDFPPNAFPPVDLLWYDGKDWKDVPDTLDAELDTITLAARCQTCGATWGDNLTDVWQLDANGDVLRKNDASGILKVPLTSGANEIHLWMQGGQTANVTRYIDFRTIVIRKQQTARIEYWLAGKESDGSKVHFGAKESERGFVGTWNGNTFTVNVTTTLTDDDGTPYNVRARMNVVCNAQRTMVNAFDEKVEVFSGSESMVLTDIKGVNVPLTSSAGNELIFGRQAAETCQSFTYVNFTFWGSVTEYWCDDESFLKIIIPKP